MGVSRPKQLFRYNRNRANSPFWKCIHFQSSCQNIFVINDLFCLIYATQGRAVKEGYLFSHDIVCSVFLLLLNGTS